MSRVEVKRAFTHNATVQVHGHRLGVPKRAFTNRSWHQPACVAPSRFGVYQHKALQRPCDRRGRHFCSLSRHAKTTGWCLCFFASGHLGASGPTCVGLERCAAVWRLRSPATASDATRCSFQTVRVTSSTRRSRTWWPRSTSPRGQESYHAHSNLDKREPTSTPVKQHKRHKDRKARTCVAIRWCDPEDMDIKGGTPTYGCSNRMIAKFCPLTCTKKKPYVRVVKEKLWTNTRKS